MGYGSEEVDFICKICDEKASAIIGWDTGHRHLQPSAEIEIKNQCKCWRNEIWEQTDEYEDAADFYYEYFEINKRPGLILESKF